MTPKNKYPTITAAFLSTTHITESDDQILFQVRDVACLSCYSLSPGYLIVIDLSDPQRFEESAQENELSEAFITLIKTMANNGHDYLYLSPVGPIADGLQKFDW